MQVGILGPVEIRGGGAPLQLPGRRLEQLVLALAQQPGRWVSAGLLTEVIWGDLTPTDPSNSLQSLVSRLRRVLGPDAPLEQSPAGYRLRIDPEDVDAVRFTRLVADGAAQLAAGDPAAGPTLDAALELWRGEPLPGDDGPDAAGQRAALVDLHVAARRDRALVDVRAGRAAAAVPRLEILATEHPLREDVAAALLDALTAAGRPADALAGYERIRAALADELGADPGPALRERHLQLLRGADRPPTAATNLPAEVTSFLGREDDVATAADRLAEGRLVTVVGPGGSGKTRLAVEVARRFVSDALVPDGVWLVELAPVGGPEEIWPALLSGLGIREVAPPDPLAERTRADVRDSVLAHLHGARCLLVVDNCEHLVDDVAATLADLLARCPGVRVLATSREALAIAGELLHPLSPLSLPAAGVSAGDPGAGPAVRLLVDRARAAGADLDLTDPATDAAVLEIVRRLDGLPLAIELAAARLRVLPAPDVARRLADRFGLLTGGRRTAVPRHRTLRAVVAWSFDLLTAAERAVAEHLAVFAVGASEEGVAAVLGADRAEVTDLLLALVDKSLITVVTTPAGTRFRMLETLREYGTDQLADRGRLTAARAAHARWWRDLVRDQDHRLRGPDQLAALTLLDTERDDVLAALHFCVDTGDAGGAVDLVVHLGWYWLLREHGAEAVRWSRELAAMPAAAGLPGAALALAWGALLGAGDDPNQAEGRSRDRRQELLDLVEGIDPAGLADFPVAQLLRQVLRVFGARRVEAIVGLEEFRRDGDPWMRAAARLGLLSVAENDGDVALVRAEADAGVAEWTAVGDRWGLAAMLTMRAEVRTLDGDLAGAADDLEQATGCLRALGGQSGEDVLVGTRLADLRLRAGDLAGARRHLAALRDLPAGVGGRSREVLRDVLVAATEGAIAIAADDAPTLRAAHDRLAALLDPVPGGDLDPHVVAIGCAAAARFAVRLGLDARRLGARAHALAVETADRPILAAVAVAAAACALATGGAREAAVLLGAADLLRGSDDPTSPAVADLVRALAKELGTTADDLRAEGRALDPEVAVELVGQAFRR